MRRSGESISRTTQRERDDETSLRVSLRRRCDTLSGAVSDPEARAGRGAAAVAT
jgi:hypothetical protein